MPRFLTACFVVLAGAALSAHSQSPSGSLSGLVADEQQTALPGAVVTAHNLDTGETRTTTSDQRGLFRLVGLPPGRYRMEISLPGFAPLVRDSIALGLSQEIEYRVTMTLAAVADSVTVSGDAPLGGSAVTTLGRAFGTSAIDEMPVAARDFASLAGQTPGIGPAADNSRTSTTGITAAGQTTRNNTFLIDGLSIDDNRLSNIRGTLSLDAIREFAVLSNAFSGEFGQASGAVVSVVTRSGTNHSMARAFYFHRDDAWDSAPGATRLVTPPEEESSLSQQIPGGFLGGPLKRNRAFYFASVEQTNRDSEQIVTSPVLHTFRPGAPTHLPVRSRSTLLFGRSDAHFGSSDHGALRYRLDRTTSTNQTTDGGPQGLIAPERHADLTRRNEDIALLYNHVFGPRALNEVRAQRSWRRNRSDTTPYCDGCVAENGRGVLLGKSPTAPNDVTEERWQATDTLTWMLPDGFGDHTIKLGADASLVGESGFEPAGASGIFTFGSDTPFDAESASTYPIRYLVNEGDPYTDFTGGIYGAFVQDTWRPVTRVTLNAGLRWDYQDAPGISDDRDNFAPRFGLAVRPWLDRQTILRASYGVFYDQVLFIISSNGLRAESTVQTIIQNPGYPNPFGFNPNRPASARPTPPSTTRFADDMDTPRTEETTAGVRHSAGVVTLVADAVWARGRRLLRSFDENYPDLDSPNPGSANRPRPDRTLGRVLVRESRGNSWYRALQLGVDTQPWHGHTFAFAYTLAQAERDTEDWDFLPQDQRNYGAERGPSASDARHRVSASASLFLPGRFRLATLLAVQSALPYNLTVGADVNGDLESTTDRPPGVSRNSARGDDLWQIDVRLSRYFRVAGLRVAGLAEAFNVFNHRNWVGFDGKQNNATFGNPTGAAPAREIQLGIKVDF